MHKCILMSVYIGFGDFVELYENGLRMDLPGI